MSGAGETGMTTRECNDVVWPGTWVSERLDVELTGAADTTGTEDTGTDAGTGPDTGTGTGTSTGELRGLLGLAVRDNPKRAHLLVSTVLGKHVPRSPHVVWRTGYDLGVRVRELLGAADAARAVVLGYAETATGLGHAVADGLADAPYLHSTRRPVAGVARAAGFEESHSHHTSHLLLPEDPELLAGTGPLVLVDDEFSTGATVLNTVRALHTRHPRERYVVVALVDMRSAADRGRLAEFAAEIGARVDLVALAAGTVRLPADVLARGRELVARYGTPAVAEEAAALPAPGAVARVELDWPRGLPDGGRHGFTPAHRARLEAALPALAERLADALAPVAGGAVATHSSGAAPAGPAEASAASGTAPAPRAAGVPGAGGTRPRVLVLGNEELMYAPLRLAEALERRLDAEVRFSTTTRSPVLAVDDPGYAIRTRLVFPAHDEPDPGHDGPGERYAYNVAGAGFDAVVAVVDSAGDTPALHAPDGLLARLAAHIPHVLLAVVPAYTPGARDAVNGARDAVNAAGAVAGHRVPGAAAALPGPLRGPAFSSYDPEEVGWLLQDLSAVTLEAPTEEREEAIQSGGAHYAESLPVEYQPSPEYQRLFRAALDDSAARIARAVGVVTETLLAERSDRPVLASLARAGTPVGVLMRRWALRRHGLDLPHYTLSIVRGRGIDTNALRWLAAHHDPADVVFVDGWTGKGAITRELAAALRDFPGFDPEIAVLADPGSCVRTYGTREDFLIPSACLNSTVSGLVSRTVLRVDLVGPDDFHGAKYYRELAGSDVSRHFLDTVGAHFEAVGAEVDTAVKELLTTDRAPSWAGWAAVERISEEYGIHDVNLVKPGVGETTRVLLRRVPWKILARRGAGADLAHVRLLAEQRGVPVEEVGELPYSCVGLIHPRYTRGATGADGRAVTTPAGGSAEASTDGSGGSPGAPAGGGPGAASGVPAVGRPGDAAGGRPGDMAGGPDGGGPA
ncbi:phosphoribosyltransferase [Streptomyces sp. LP05-1]|uniref:Phosphoribosyltransferase n=1 Tax=Streptomyces pyxinae TaxID=2970734 RepID=A0ABT2CNJ6_9ACTN|nr:phosphoribosyltransferase [Streptomyces sp. LP05-1]MCS0638266.1 phosphoribosyltransferase [Streptomyces sp. LP05-1]